MTGFEIARYSEDDVLQKIAELQEMSALPVDEDGQLIPDDPLSVESAREMRLLLQRLFELHPMRFFAEMRRLYFHLFAIDHDHYRDLLRLAARTHAGDVRQLGVDLLLSEDVIFLEDQRTLRHVLDVLAEIPLEDFPSEEIAELKSLWSDPFFRLPSLHARLIRWLSPLLDEIDINPIRTLFEMGLIPSKDLSWSDVREFFSSKVKSNAKLSSPELRPQNYLSGISLDDFEDLRWSLGIDGTANALKFRMLGASLAAGPGARGRFVELCESQPETIFHREVFETPSQRAYFWSGLERWKNVVLRDAHWSRRWFHDLPDDRVWPWTAELPPDPWPRPLRSLPGHWGEFANAMDRSTFAAENPEAILRLDRLAEELTDLLQQHPWPTGEDLQQGESILERFDAEWGRLWPQMRPQLDLFP